MTQDEVIVEIQEIVIEEDHGETPEDYDRWFGRVFAPVIDISNDQVFDIEEAAVGRGIARFTLGYISATQDGVPAWGGKVPTSSLAYLEEIIKLRSLGGDVCFTFGSTDGNAIEILMIRS